MASFFFKPPDRDELEAKFNAVLPLYKQLKKEVDLVLDRSIKERVIKISHMESRIKKFDRFYKNLIINQISGDPFESHVSEDITGARIICLYRDDLKKIEDLIKEQFCIKRVKLFREQKDMLFGYTSDHYIVTLPDHLSGERYDNIKSLKCDIQVRTIGMHAWAIMSHNLVYKREVDIPSELKKDFYALSGVFYIADSLFKQFREAREESLERYEELKETGFIIDEEINIEGLQAYLSWKFPDREKSYLYFYSQILLGLIMKKIYNYEQLNKIIDQYMDWFLDYEEKNPPDKLVINGGYPKVVSPKEGEKTKFNDTDVVRIIINKEFDDWFEEFYDKYIREQYE